MVKAAWMGNGSWLGMNDVAVGIRSVNGQLVRWYSRNK